MTEVTLAEAQARLPALIAGLPAGGTVVITDADRPVATVTVHPHPPADPTAVRPGYGAGKGKLIEWIDDGSHLDDFAEYM
jgi:antitoxin (DNA-binding transcriptional repressor) of toxin-antitoxin stability system